MASTYVETSWTERSSLDDEARDGSRMDDAADLWSDEERVLAAWKAQRARRWVVRWIGGACVLSVCAVFARVGMSPTARGEMIAWGTLGQVAPSRAAAMVSSDRSTEGTVQENGAALAEMAPAPSVVAAPAMEAPAPPVVAAPAMEAPAAPTAVVGAAPARASMHVASRRSRSDTDAPGATPSKPVAPRTEKEKDDADDLYH